ncbi:MAG: deoxyguanosinetriphosphate triphosphohydrolase [Candidatus Gygaella obscura]|nr:deoxyguanosinetriphosphate triphosphohydrolase [Candidatus Gygaella obscura]
MDRNYLAKYAISETDSKGRVFKEAEHAYRNIYERDRDRIIHSAAFRRLEYKTQVFVIIEGDYYRTRLTHTLEVCQIARTIACALGLNEPLVEAIALAHDLGHTPFGHAGENALNKLNKENGGFNHNCQSLKVVDEMEQRYPDFKGLNLTWETREGIIRHTSTYDKQGKHKEFCIFPNASLETQVVDIADEIAYDNHDIDDGLTAGLLQEKELKKIELWNEIHVKVENKYPGIKKDIRKFQIIKEMINTQVTDIIDTSKAMLEEIKPDCVDDVRKYKQKFITFSKLIQQKRVPLREFLKKSLYEHYRVVRMSTKAKRFIEELFNEYLQNPKQLPVEYQAKISDLNNKKMLKSLLCDYIAGMTDRYALDEHKKLFDTYEKV